MGTRIFETDIRNTVAVGDAALMRGNLFDDQKGATATQDYKDFVDEFIKYSK